VLLRIAIAVLASATILAFVACKSNAHIEAASDLTCLQNTELHTCECNAFGPVSDDPSDAVVSGCDVPPAGVTWDCTIQGTSPNVTDCTCGVAICFLADADTCKCEVVLRPKDLGGVDQSTDVEGGVPEAGESSVVAQHPIQSQCTAAVGHCCQDATSCICSSATCATGTSEVATCAPPAPAHSPNCSGLVWVGQ
jgi:hypothetical protein